jgi:hypothetical protein
MPTRSGASTAAYGTSTKDDFAKVVSLAESADQVPKDIAEARASLAKAR